MIRIRVLLPNNEPRTVQVNELSTTSELVLMCYQKEGLKLYPFVLFNGKILDYGLSLKSQGVADNDTLVLYESKSIKSCNETQTPISTIPITTFAEKVKGVMREVLKLNDNVFSSMENDPLSNRIYKELALNLESGASDAKSFPKTVIPTKHEKPSELPIEIHFENDELEEEECDGDEDYNITSMFESIEEAGKFFKKHPFSEWAW